MVRRRSNLGLPKIGAMSVTVVLSGLTCSADAAPPHTVAARATEPGGTDAAEAMNAIWSLGLDATWADCLVYDERTGMPSIDAQCFYEHLIERYASLSKYRDLSKVVQTITPPQGPPARVRTRLHVAVDDGQVRVDSPRSALTRRIAERLPVRRPGLVAEKATQRDQWIAPHLVVQPARDGADRADAGLSAALADAAVFKDRPMVHIELTTSDRESADGPTTTVDLYVDPESMLVERAARTEQLPGGGEYHSESDVDVIVAEESVPARDLGNGPPSE